MAGRDALLAHLACGTTTVCRAWAVVRRDGQVLGFTDHDRDLAFDGVLFRAGSGLSARALEQTTGLAVDNSEAMGALSDAAIREEDIAAGRFDGAEVRIWRVNWADPDSRMEEFRGTIGEISRIGPEFRAELRGLTEALNQATGRVFGRSCDASLGDGRCRFDLTLPGYGTEARIAGIRAPHLLVFDGLTEFASRWFERGLVEFVDGPAAGLSAQIRMDSRLATGRELALWTRPGNAPQVGDVVRLVPGCDKRAETCQIKFNNFNNFRGFPHIPGEDWLASYPTGGGDKSGGRRG